MKKKKEINMRPIKANRCAGLMKKYTIKYIASSKLMRTFQWLEHKNMQLDDMIVKKIQWREPNYKKERERPTTRWKRQLLDFRQKDAKN